MLVVRQCLWLTLYLNGGTGKSRVKRGKSGVAVALYLVF